MNSPPGSPRNRGRSPGHASPPGSPRMRPRSPGHTSPKSPPPNQGPFPRYAQAQANNNPRAHNRTQPCVIDFNLRDDPMDHLKAANAARRTMSRDDFTEDELSNIINSMFDSLATKPSKEEKGEPFITTATLEANFKEFRVFTDIDIQYLIHNLDADGNGKCDKEEFSTAMKKRLRERTGCDLLQSFRILDHDNDGFISSCEFRRAVMTYGNCPYSEFEADQLLLFADRYGDGMIEYEKFLDRLDNPERENPRRAGVK
eukprot:GEMP01036077.1.p1 GENE.GEMP01036077.1~~GEMP01036077.1.p1  ORF type:complete len:258 (+),score=54.13 GEMP01036077.1:46-819(+)